LAKLSTALVTATLLVLAGGCASEDRAASADDPGPTVSATPAVAPAAPVATAPPLAEGELPDSIDFLVDGFVLGMDSTAVRTLLGNPDSVRAIDNPLDRGAIMVTWYYPAIIVDLMFDGALTGVTLLDDSRATHRGLRVGDPQERVFALYGPNTLRPEGILDYSWVREYQRVVRISLIRGRVTQIFVGVLLD
jgi:hypothetical protein